MVLRIIDSIGSSFINTCNNIGTFTIFVSNVFKKLFFTRPKFSKLLSQIERIGVNSLVIATITGGFAGAVLAIQSFKGFKQMGGEDLIGPVVALSMVRELGPVLTGLMVAGRCSSAIAAEIGTMRVTEQIDALRTLRIDIFQYLIIPRILAGIIVLPMLAIFSMMCGIFGGYIVCTNVLGLAPESFYSGIKDFITVSDVMGGITKACVFGFILTAVGSYKGYYTSGGALGVGIATTQSVVLSSILIIIANYFLAIILFGP